jgi:hypothetical protein
MFLTTVDEFKDYMRFLIQTFQASTISGILWFDVLILEQAIEPEPLYYDAAEIESEVRTPANTQSNLHSSLVFPPNYLCQFLDKASEVYCFSLYLPSYKNIIAHHNFFLTIATTLLSEKVNVILFDSTRNTTQTSMMMIWQKSFTICLLIMMSHRTLYIVTLMAMDMKLQNRASSYLSPNLILNLQRIYAR